MGIRFVSVAPQELVGRLNIGMAVFYGLLGLFGLFFVGAIDAQGKGPGPAYLSLCAALIGAHCLLGWGARQGRAWARWGSVLGGLLLIATAYYGVLAGPVLGIAIVYYALKPWRQS